MTKNEDQKFDVVIIGAGLAGLQCARLLSRQGAKILLVDRKQDLTKGIHTTGIFVRKTFEDFNFPAGTLGKPVRDVTLYSPKLRSLKLKSKNDEFRVGKMGALYESLLREAKESGVEFSSGTRYISALPVNAVHGQTETIIHLEREGAPFKVKAKVVVGADGANSRVARDLGLDENREVIVGYEEVWRGVPPESEPRLHCFLDAKLAPGYLAWVTNDGEDVHIGVGGYAEKFDPRSALKEFKQKIAGKIVDLQTGELAETRGGKIPVGGVLKNIANEFGLLIGDASGAVSPLTAGGLDPCLRLSQIAAGVIAERLKIGDPEILKTYSGELFRARFISRIWMRRLLAVLSNQFLIETGCRVLRLPFFGRFAAHVFFGRGSFPDDVKLPIAAKAKISRI
jgi:geranylgeranyl reductase family protein